MNGTHAKVIFLSQMILGCLVWGVAVTAMTKADESVRVASFNIRFNNPDDGENAWPHRRDWVGEMIREQDPDVLGLQEVLKSQIDDLQQRLPNYRWYGVGRDDGQEAGEYAPIFYRADRFELVDKGHFWLCEKPDEPGRKDWNAACTRMATWVALRRKAPARDGATGDSPATPKQYFFNTHFDHQSAEARRNSAELLRTRIAAIQDGPVVLTGDFNCGSQSEPISLLTSTAEGLERGVLTDAYELGKDLHQGPLSTWNGFRAIQPGQRIDFVFVSPQWQVTGHRILDEQREGRFPSDHCPVLAELSLK
jgi:endonuclease/exonuclease/phosphatase family metal-dependent hydrolase